MCNRWIRLLVAIGGGLLSLAVLLQVNAPALRARPLAARMANAGDVVINEVAWMGTAADFNDEWIELYNTTGQALNLNGWRLRAGSGTPTIVLTGTVPAGGYYLLERSDDSPLTDIPADQIYTGALNNSGDTLTLTDAFSNVIDTANENGGAWPGGTNTPKATMERKDAWATDTDDNWSSNTGLIRNGLDANGNPITGTPGCRNSVATPAADLILQGTGPLTVAPGAPLAYTLHLRNAGNQLAVATALTLTLPENTRWLTQSSPFTFTAPTSTTLLWEIGDLPISTTPALLTVVLTLTEEASGTLIARAVATTVLTEATPFNNALLLTTTVQTTTPPPPPAEVRLYALAPTNYAGSGEAAALINLSPYTATVAGWCLDDDLNPGNRRLCLPPGATMAPGEIHWLAENAAGFGPVWGFIPQWTTATLTGQWPGFTDDGEVAYLLDAGGQVQDALPYGKGNATQGWSGAAVPYPYAGFGSGQVLYRKLDPTTGRPVTDTDQAADWAQDPADPFNGRKLRYPGWDLETLFFPTEISATTALTLAVAPDGLLPLVTQTIAAARSNLRLEGYTLESLPVYEALRERIQAGVVVTVLLESAPAGGLSNEGKWIAQQLHTPPTSTVYFIGKTAARYRYQHAKFILVDDRLALVSSDNFGENSLPSDPKENGTLGHRGFAVVTDQSAAIAALDRLFRLDCDPLHHLDVAPYDSSYAPPAGFVPLPPPDWTTYTAPFTASFVATATHLTVMHAPEHSLRAPDALLGLVNQTGAGDTIAAMQLNEPTTWTVGVGAVGLNPRVQALLAAARRGAAVRLLLDDYYEDGNNTATCLYLNGLARTESLSLSCRLANPAGLGIHAKLFLVQVGAEQWGHLGSLNGTETSNKANREVALQMASATAYAALSTVFEADWAHSHPPYDVHLYLPLVLRDYRGPAQYPLISEIFINPEGDDAGQEWIELYNPGPTVSLAGWLLGDAINAGDYGDGRYQFPPGAALLPQQVIVVAACTTPFATAYGFNPDYEWTDCSPTVPDLQPVGMWNGFGLALGNTQDEVVLHHQAGGIVDSVAWNGAPRLGVIPFPLPEPPFPSGASLKRYPAWSDYDDCSRDFYVSFSPSPRVVSGP